MSPRSDAGPADPGSGSSEERTPQRAQASTSRGALQRLDKCSALCQGLAQRRLEAPACTETAAATKASAAAKNAAATEAPAAAKNTATEAATPYAAAAAAVTTTPDRATAEAARPEVGVGATGSVALLPV
jgi:hypothetical protein